jgi:hypothetical protein
VRSSLARSRSTRPGYRSRRLLEAAQSFLSGLTAEQRKRATFEIGDEAWRKWSNIHPWLMRHGICLTDFDGHQREAALALMRETMSAAWY